MEKTESKSELTPEMVIKEVNVSVHVFSIKGLDNNMENNVDFYIDHHEDEQGQLDENDNHKGK